MARALTLWTLSSLLGYVVSASTNSTFDYDVIQYIDPLIGTANGGDVFPGATLPNGMAKAVADTNSDSNQGGFTLDGSPITGFSSMHDSGTGGNPSLGNFALFPYTSCVNDTIDGCTYPKRSRPVAFDNTSVVATPGYFAVTLNTGIKVDMTTAQHTSLFRFQFPTTPSPESPLILMDLTDLSDSRQDNATIDVDESSGRMTGSGRFLPSFGSGNYIAYFCADFRSASAIRDNGIFVNSRATSEAKSLKISRSINGYPLPVRVIKSRLLLVSIADGTFTAKGGAWIRFNASTHSSVIARVGISLISENQACSNAENEIPSFDFNSTYSTAVATWREKLSPIRVSRSTVNESFLTNFYSGIYRTMIQPQDYTGENPLWKSAEPYFDSLYCIWDLFRSQMPFMTLMDPATVTRIIRSLIDTQQHLGWLPDCRMSLCKGYTQGGSNADNIIADAYIKGLLDGIDWDAAYSAVQKDAEVEPYDWSNEGRGGLASWKSLNYIPVQDLDYVGFGTMTRSISRTLEYSYNDFAISQIARGMNRTADAEKYEQNSGYWQSLFRADQRSYYKNGTDTGFVGFFQPKYLNQTWGYQDPLMCSNIDNSGSICSLQNNAAETFESSIWEYQFFVPHDMASLITLLGGPSTFVKRLDYLHDEQITYIGNEPAFLTVFQYHYAGRPGKSASRAHYYIPGYFQVSPGGLPGNDDSGTMGAFVAMSMMGLFPNPAQNVYFIIPPFFESVQYTSPLTNRTSTIKTVNFDADYKNIYIQSATLNGQPYTKNWIDHSFFTDGMELVLTLGPNESTWGTRDADLPPSLSTQNRSGLKQRRAEIGLVHPYNGMF